MNKIPNTYKADQGLCLLKRLENGQYMNLTDLDFENSCNFNNDFYDVVDIDSEYILMADVIPGRTVYAPVSLDDLIVYAPSIKKLKRCSIADVIIARLIYENTSIRFSIEKRNGHNIELKIWLRVSKDNNTRYEVTSESSFAGVMECL